MARKLLGPGPVDPQDAATKGYADTKLRWAGVYDAEADYLANDVVFEHTTLWVATGASTGEAPGEGPWTRLVDSQTLADWDDQAAYRIGDLVTRSGTLYRALADNTDTEPAAHPASWLPLVGLLEATVVEGVVTAASLPYPLTITGNLSATNLSGTNTGDQDLSPLVPKASTDASGFGFVLGENTFASNSATKVPTQASVKSYVDTGLATKSNTGHTHIPSQVGLGNVDNTSDATKNAAAVTLTNKTISLTNNTVSGSTAEFNTALTDNDFATLAGIETLTNKSLSGTANTVTNISADSLLDGTTLKAYTATERTKLDGIATGATANATDSYLLDRTHHTGTQSATTISDFSTAADARITAATGVSVQPYDTELAALAGLSSAADKAPYFTGSGTAALTDLSSFGRSLIDDTDAATARATLGVSIGSQVQAWDADLDTWATKTPPSGTAVGTSDTQTLTGKTLSGSDNTFSDIPQSAVTGLVSDLSGKQSLDATLTALAALSTAADKLIYATAADTFTTTDLTATARSLLDDSSAEAMRTTLGVSYGTTSGTVAQGNDSRITGAEQTANKGQANGYASLDGAGKVPITQLPSSIMEYQGVWSAATNTPTLADGTGSTGDVYRVTAGGSVNFGSGAISFEVGDYAIYNGTVWEKSDTTDAVGSVAGLTGTITTSGLKTALSLDNVDNTSDATKNAAIATLTNKTISGASNTLSDIPQSAVTNLGTDLSGKQPLDATLTALAGVSTAADALIYATGADTFTTTTLSATARSLLDDATTADMRTTLGLAIGTNVQAWDTELDTWSTKTAPAGVVVGDTDTQTLTNKTLSAPTLTDPALGTPASGTLTNCTGLPVAGISSSTSTALGVGSLEVGHASDTTITRSGAGKIAVEGVEVLLSGGALGTPSSATLTNATGLPVSGITASTTSPLGVGSVELGHADDTTISRAAAGKIAVEGVEVLLSGGALGTPSSATLTNATGLPVSGIVSSTATALGLGSIELGHASDTTISRAGSGQIAVEGVAVPTISSSDTLTNKAISGSANTLTNIALASLAATGTPSSSSYLRGDGTWSVPGGTGDVNTTFATSVDSEVAVFDGTGGKTLKRATGTGLATLSSGVLGTVTAPTGAVVGTTDTQTLTGKTISGSDNTLSNIAQSSITGLASDLSGKQPLDATLTALAALSTAADKLIYATAADTFSTTDLTSTARTLLDDATTADMRSTLGVVIGTDVQAYSSTLSSWAAKTVPSGYVVGTSDTQDLTNKDLTSATNTFPTFNQNTTGSAAKWTTARNLAGNSVDGSADVAFANKFIAQGTTDAGLSGAQFLGALSTGLVKNTTSTGVLSIAAAGTDYVAPGGDLGTPSSGTLTNTTGLPISGLVASTSAALGVGSIELGHASDTTISRVSAGVIAVEGATLATQSYVSSSIGATRYSATIGDGTSTSFVLSHNLGTRSVLVSVYDATSYEEVNCDKVRTDANTVTLGFASAPATGAYVAVIIGGAASGGATIASTDITDSTTTGRSILTAASTTAVKSSLGLENVSNTSDATKNSASATLTNKTLDLASNAITGTTAQFNTALSDNDFATQAGVETFTNKTISATTNTITGISSAGLYASMPAASAVASGSLYVCTDIGDDYVSDGVSWNKIRVNGMGSSIMGTPSALPSTITTGGGTITTDKGCRVITSTTSNVGYFTGEYQPVGSNYTARAYIDLSRIPLDENWYVGIMLYDSGSGKMAVFGLQCNSASIQLGADKWSNTSNGYVAAYGTTINLFPNFPTWTQPWLQIRDDGVNRYFEYSFNGVDWALHTSISRTDYLTPTSIGWGIGNSNPAVIARLRSWKVA